MTRASEISRSDKKFMTVAPGQSLEIKWRRTKQKAPDCHIKEDFRISNTSLRQFLTWFAESH